MPKLKCKNKYCKFHRGSGCSKKSVTLDRKGRCETYEPGFAYYFFYCCEHMQTNFLTYPEINEYPAYKYSIYYMTKCLPVKCYSDDIRGMLVICDSRTKKPLNANDLIELLNDNLDENMPKIVSRKNRTFSIKFCILYISKKSKRKEQKKCQKQNAKVKKNWPCKNDTGTR